jgi:hypothetical protein
MKGERVNKRTVTMTEHSSRRCGACWDCKKKKNEKKSTNTPPHTHNIARVALTDSVGALEETCLLLGSVLNDLVGGIGALSTKRGPEISGLAALADDISLAWHDALGQGLGSFAFVTGRALA